MQMYRLAKLCFIAAFLSGCGASDDEPPVDGGSGSDASPDAGETGLRFRLLTANIASYTKIDGVTTTENLLPALNASDADVWILQEPGYFNTTDAEAVIAAADGYEHAIPTAADTGECVWVCPSFASRWPVVERLKYGVVVEPCDGVRLNVLGVHHISVPFYSDQVLETDPPPSADEMIAASRSSRGPETDKMEAQLQPLIANNDWVFLGGDFNEPSHRDWAEPHEQNLGLVVNWPHSQRYEALGMTDSYRSLYPDVAAKPGNTWTPYKQPPNAKGGENEIDGRIDRIYHAGTEAQVVSAQVIGESSDAADIVVTPYPSDHRFLVVEYLLPGVTCPGE